MAPATSWSFQILQYQALPVKRGGNLQKKSVEALNQKVDPYTEADFFDGNTWTQVEGFQPRS